MRYTKKKLMSYVGRLFYRAERLEDGEPFAEILWIILGVRKSVNGYTFIMSPLYNDHELLYREFIAREILCDDNLVWPGGEKNTNVGEGTSD